MSSSRISWETLLKGTDEKIAYALVPERETMAATIVTRGTRLDATPFVTLQGCLPEFKAYVFVGAEAIRTQEGSFTRFSFIKNYGTNPVTPVQTTYTKRPHPWPAVLGNLTLQGCVATDRELVGNADASTYIIQVPSDIPVVTPKWSRDAYDGITTFKVETWISNVKFDLSESTVHANGLYGRSIHFDRHVFAPSLPPCLHVVVLVPVINVDINSSTLFAIYPAETFAATTFTDWAEHVVQDEAPEMPQGYFQRQRLTALVPTLTP